MRNLRLIRHRQTTVISIGRFMQLENKYNIIEKRKEKQRIRFIIFLINKSSINYRQHYKHSYFFLRDQLRHV